MSQEMNKNIKPTSIGKNENVENPLTTTPQTRTGDKPAEIIYREIRIVEPSAELLQDLKNRESAGKHIAGLGHDKSSAPTAFAHDKPLHDKPLHDKPLHDKPTEHIPAKFGAGKPVHDLGHDDSGHKVKMGPADLSDKLHGERLKDKDYSDAPKHDKDAYIGKEHRSGDKHGPTELKEEKHIGDKYHNNKGLDLGQNLGKGYDDGAAAKYDVSPRDKHITAPTLAPTVAHQPHHVGVGDKTVAVDKHHHSGDKHLPYPAEDRHIGRDHPTELKEEKHIGDKYHDNKGHDLGQNLGKGYDDGAAAKYDVSPRDKHVDGEKHGLLGKKSHSPRDKHIDDGEKHGLLGKRSHSHEHADDGEKHGLFGMRSHSRDKHDKNVDDGEKHGLFGKKHDHDKDDDGHKHKHKHGLFGKKHDHDKDLDKHPKTHDKHIVPDAAAAVPYDKHTLHDGDVVAHGEKVKDKHELKEADHIGDKYITKRGWDFGQNLGKKYDDQDSYKLTDGERYVPDKDKTLEDNRLGDRPHERLHAGAPVAAAPVAAAPVVAAPVAPAAALAPAAVPATAADERITVPSAHGERVYGHELKEGDRHVGKHPAREEVILDDEYRKDKHLKDKDYTAEVTDESHKKPGVITKVVEKVKGVFSSKDKSSDSTTDPTTDKGAHWEKVPDDGEGHWKDRGVVGDKHKSKETY
jgi:hypothetical protein